MAAKVDIPKEDRKARARKEVRKEARTRRAKAKVSTKERAMEAATTAVEFVVNKGIGAMNALRRSTTSMLEEKFMAVMQLQQMNLP
jgi:hypothetical protein